jgi:hypothetical protein
MDIRQKSAEIGQHLRRLQFRLGRLGVFAAVLLALAVLELFTGTLPALQSGSELETQLQSLRDTMRDGREIKRGTDDTPAAQIAAFERFFPPMADINHVLGDIYTAADKEKLVLERGEYNLSEESGLAVLRYKINLPVKGPQADIKRFVRRMLRDIPSVSLDSISMQRNNVGEPTVDAQIRLSVFLRGAP